MTEQTLLQKTAKYLTDHNVMTIATSGPQGIWAAAVFYAHDAGFNLYFLSAPTTRHSQNIAANPAVAVTIQADYKDWPEIKGIQMEGQAHRLEGADKARAIQIYGEKFALIANIDQAPPKISQAFRKIAWYKIGPQRLYFIDNSLGFGHRDELQLT